MKIKLMKNRVFILAMVLALVGAALLGTGFACAVQKEAAAAVLVEREQTVEILENSEGMPTPPPKEPQAGDKTAVSTAQDAKIDADTALAMANHAAETLMDMQFPKDTIVEYIPAKEDADARFATPAYWSVKDPAEEGGLYAQFDAETGAMTYVTCGEVFRNGLDGWGTATVEDGEAIIDDPSLVLAESEKRIAAFRPDQTVQETWLHMVHRQEGYLMPYVFVTTEETTYSLTFILINGIYELLDCACFNEIVEQHDGYTAVFYDNDADAWMWELESFDDIKLVNPRKFEKADPKDAAIGKEEIERRCKNFYETATGETFLGVITMQYFKDMSLEREDYYTIKMNEGDKVLRLALSAETGDLLAWEGELPVQPILMENAKKLWDWCWEDESPEFAHALAWLEKTVETFCGEESVKTVSVNAVHDDYYMTLDAEMTTGRIHEFGFEIKDGKAKLQYVEVYYNWDAFGEYMVPWAADARVIDPNSGDIKLGWFGPEKLGGELLP